MVRRILRIRPSATVGKCGSANLSHYANAILVEAAQDVGANEHLVEGVPKVVECLCLLVIKRARRAIIPVTEIIPHRVVEKRMRPSLYYPLSPQCNIPCGNGVQTT